MPRYFFFCSSLPATMTGALAKPLASNAVGRRRVDSARAEPMRVIRQFMSSLFGASFPPCKVERQLPCSSATVAGCVAHLWPFLRTHTRVPLIQQPN